MDEYHLRTFQIVCTKLSQSLTSVRTCVYKAIMAKTERIDIRVTPEQLAELQRRAGEVPLGRWMVARCLEPMTLVEKIDILPPARKAKVEKRTGELAAAIPRPVEPENVTFTGTQEPRRECRECRRKEGELHDNRCGKGGFGKRV